MNRYLDTKKIISLILFVLYMGPVWLVAQETPRKYVSFKAIDGIQVDGMDKEDSWKKADWSDTFIDIEGKKEPTYKTQMKMVWDEEYLYFFAKLEEPNVWGTLKQRDTIIFYNNDFEIFIDPDGDTHNYMEFEMNALNTIWDLFLTKPYRNQGKVLDSWDIQGVMTAVHVEGTLNNPNDIDKGWSVEIAIPWEVLKEANSHNDIPVNEFWRFGFSRVNWEFEVVDGRYARKKDAKGNYLPEYNWVWSPQWVINMHEPEKWGYVYFSEKEVGTADTFSIPGDEHIKWYLYELYRDLINGEKKEGAWKKADGQAFGTTKKILGKKIVPVLERHKDGFILWTKSPFTNKTLMIKDDGKFSSID
ncbi:carbohydrate-binding family 9-like protein [Maribacter sp. ANRC-HE7]|uniref:Carbohydrate-binding family 9-like protein n=1 Tax=Maribacter aquimaris TaxID=2737171 RepID=A0ABR7V3N1_9FLAO|nr:carbohydrate-binding family 9-like protein [Maribacter aquimaris]MBD0779047.1 carbohydrate-binding family 9-like protein [Maribacter aquimaris]